MQMNLAGLFKILMTHMNILTKLVSDTDRHHKSLRLKFVLMKFAHEPMYAIKQLGLN